MVVDILLFVAGALFAVSLVPQVLRNFARRSAADFSLVTCVATTVGLIIVTGCFVHLGYWLAVSVNVVSVVCWGTILMQRIVGRW